MPLYTCPRCHYTFSSPDKPGACPDCGSLRPVPASEVEFNRFYTEKIEFLRSEHVDGMTLDERNWTLILLFLNRPKVAFYTSHLLRHYVLEAEPALRLDTYKGFRWEFTRRVKEDRIALQLEGHREPRTLLRSDDGTPLVRGWEFYGAALRTLYSFETEDEHKVPNVKTINQIDLEKIANSPSAAYMQFLWDWLDAVKDVPWSEDSPDVKPLLKLMKDGEKLE